MMKKDFKTKLTALGLGVVMAAAVFTGCGNKKDFTFTEALTNKDYQLWYEVRAGETDKNGNAGSLYYIHDGKISEISFGDGKMVNDGLHTRFTKDFSELSKMSDEEIIEYYSQYPDEWGTADLTFTGLTDGTGNNAEMIRTCSFSDKYTEESAEKRRNLGYYATELSLGVDWDSRNCSSFTVYDSTYTGFVDSDGDGIYTRTNDPEVTFTMDSVDSKDVNWVEDEDDYWE